MYAELERLGGEFEADCYLLTGAEAVDRGGEGGLPDVFERVLLKAEVLWDSVPHPHRYAYCLHFAE